MYNVGLIGLYINHIYYSNYQYTPCWYCCYCY